MNTKKLKSTLAYSFAMLAASLLGGCAGEKTHAITFEGPNSQVSFKIEKQNKNPGHNAESESD